MIHPEYHIPVSPPQVGPSNPYSPSSRTELPSLKPFDGSPISLSIKPASLPGQSLLPRPQPHLPLRSSHSPNSSHTGLLPGTGERPAQGLFTGSFLYLGQSTAIPLCLGLVPLHQVSAYLPLLREASPDLQANGESTVVPSSIVLFSSFNRYHNL